MTDQESNENSDEVWLRTDEMEEFIGALEFCAELSETVRDDVMRWKWLIVALHNALQGACVGALRGQDTAGLNGDLFSTRQEQRAGGGSQAFGKPGD